jgi:hypothetical protein
MTAIETLTGHVGCSKPVATLIALLSGSIDSDGSAMTALTRAMIAAAVPTEMREKLRDDPSTLFKKAVNAPMENSDEFGVAISLILDRPDESELKYACAACLECCRSSKLGTNVKGRHICPSCHSDAMLPRSIHKYVRGLYHILVMGDAFRAREPIMVCEYPIVVGGLHGFRATYARLAVEKPRAGATGNFQFHFRDEMDDGNTYAHHP